MHDDDIVRRDEVQCRSDSLVKEIRIDVLGSEVRNPQIESRALRPNRAVAFMIVSAYLAVAALLVLGMWQTHVPQHRL